MRIENCIVNNVNRWGIAVGYTAYWEKFPDAGDKEIPDADIAAYGSTNVVIRNNYVKDAGGDAITPMYCDRPLVEYNVSDGVARQINTTDYCKNNNAAQTKIVGRVAAAIWPWKCKDAVFQYNEAFDTRNGDAGNDDAQAWDADTGDGTLYQYNYSHNNTGGCVMFCYPRSYRNTFRYNISTHPLDVLPAPHRPFHGLHASDLRDASGHQLPRPDTPGLCPRARVITACHSVHICGMPLPLRSDMATLRFQPLLENDL